ncbi:hypothetical protein M422DRAFT_45463 [Sphaerobolus stellatus SS14]|nr:hypothetical protein M422DRAFT_45463 [Sphaerobolus stellatus SS14]
MKDSQKRLELRCTDWNRPETSQKVHEFGWWSEESRLSIEEEMALIVQKKRISNFKWLDTFTIMAMCASTKEDIRLISHTRYTLLMNCYGFMCCSCAGFLKYGQACKHLWAMCLVVTQMKTSYTFIFPSMQEEAEKIFSTLYSPSRLINCDTGAMNGVPKPTLVEDGSRPQPPINYVGEIASQTVEVIQSLGEEVDEESDGDEDRTDGEVFIINTSTSLRDQNEAAIAKQLQSWLSHELQHTVPKLFGIQSILQQCGPSLVRNPALQELEDIAISLAKYLRSLPAVQVESETEGLPKPGSSGTAVNTEKKTEGAIPKTSVATTHKRSALVPPSPERNQKCKRSTGIF